MKHRFVVIFGFIVIVIAFVFSLAPLNCGGGARIVTHTGQDGNVTTYTVVASPDPNCSEITSYSPILVGLGAGIIAIGFFLNDKTQSKSPIQNEKGALLGTQ